MIKLNLILLIDGIYLLQDNFDLLVRDIDLGELGLRLVENIPYNWFCLKIVVIYALLVHIWKLCKRITELSVQGIIGIWI